MRLVVAVALLSVLACTPKVSPDTNIREARSQAVAEAKAAAEAAAKTPVVQEPTLALEHRVHGAIAGGFVVPRQQVRVAEPIMVSFEVRSTKGPMVVFVGGDGRNAANFPMRVGVKVERPADDNAGDPSELLRTVVCDSVAAPALPSFGGPGSDRTLAEGELLRESFVLNPVCPALSTPGDYRVTLHRKITNMGMVTKVGRDRVPTSCDMHPVHEDSALTGMPGECVRMLEAVPWVTTTFDLKVLPYEPMAVKASIDAAYERARAADPDDEMARHRVNAWLCGWVTCGCAKPDDAPTMLLPETTPQTLADGCHRAGATATAAR